MTAYEQGYKAYHDLLEPEDNPFVNCKSEEFMLDDDTMWQLGWTEAMLESVNQWVPSEVQ